MAQVATFQIGTVGIPSTLLRHPPVPTITAPVGTVTTSTITVTWTYFSQLARTQKAFRVLLTTTTNDALFDSGVLQGAATSYALSYTLTPFTTYRVLVGVSDGFDGDLDAFASLGGFAVFAPGWAGSTFFAEFSTSAAYPDNQKVGSIYEIAINGVGYMLADNPERPVQHRVAQLSPERFATGDTPFAEAIDRYNFLGFSDWRAGSGQLYRDRPTADVSAYFYSERVNPFEMGEVSCLDGLTHHIASTYVAAVNVLNQATVASGAAYVTTGSQQLTHRATPAGPNTAFNPGLAGTILDLTSDGTNWYVTDGATIRRNNAAADPAANWSLEDVTEIEWCTDRIIGIDNVASPPEIISFSPTGVGTLITTHAGAALRGICGGDGFVWYGANYTGTGHVRFWQVDSSPSVLGIALTLPEGEKVDNLYFYLGNVFIAARTDDGRIKIYRCITSEGRLTPELIVAYDESASLLYQVQFAGMDRFVAFAWYTMQRTAESGIGVIDLESGGYARWHAGGSAELGLGSEVTGVVRWAGEFGVRFTDGDAQAGFYGAATSPQAVSGFIETSVSDLASNVIKVLDSVALTTKPLNGSVEVLYSVNTNDTFTSIGTLSGAGASTTVLPVDSALSSSFGFRLVLTPEGSEGPVVKLLQAKAFPQGLADQIVVLPINCADQLAGLNDHPLPESRPGGGMVRTRTLEALVGSIAKLQDIDWPRTRQSLTYQVVAAEMDTIGVFDRQQTQRVDSPVCVLTLRRALN